MLLCREMLVHLHESFSRLGGPGVELEGHGQLLRQCQVNSKVVAPTFYLSIPFMKHVSHHQPGCSEPHFLPVPCERDLVTYLEVGVLAASVHLKSD